MYKLCVQSRENLNIHIHFLCCQHARGPPKPQVAICRHWNLNNAGMLSIIVTSGKIITRVQELLDHPKKLLKALEQKQCDHLFVLIDVVLHRMK